MAILPSLCMSLRRWVVQKSLKTPLRNIKMAPYSFYVKSIGTFALTLFGYIMPDLASVYQEYINRDLNTKSDLLI